MVAVLDTRELEQRVKRMYEEVALHPERQFHFETGRALAERLGYPAGGLAEVPAGAVDSFAGVGYFFDLADVRAGETVLDLGSGSGLDSLLAARLVGPAGRAIGIDMTDAQLRKARELARSAGLANVEFRAGHIETTGLRDRSVDLVISNGVVNLAPDKERVFREVARVLRPGGRLAVADIVTDDPLPEAVSCDASLWAACIGGAMQASRYQEAIEEAGLSIKVGRRNDYRFLSDSAVNATRQWGVSSISLLAVRAS